METKVGLYDTIKRNKVLFMLLKGFGVLLLLFVLIYLGLGIYLSARKDKIKNNLTELINEKSTGEIKIGDLEVSLFQGFPSLTVQVKNVTVKDSLWHLHKRTLLKADKVYAKVSPWAILKKTISVNNLTIKNAVIDIYADEKGYSNVSVFTNFKKKKKEEEKEKSALEVNIDEIDFTDVTFISENQIKKKNFNFKTSNLEVLMSRNETGWKAAVDVKTFVNNMAFNTTRGSFAEKKSIKGKLDVVYESEKKQIGIYSNELNIGNNPFEVKATFGTSKNNPLFKIMLFCPSIQWREASSLLSNNIKTKLDKFNLSEPFDVRCNIKGNLNIKGNPSIHVIANMENNKLITKNEIIDDCNFKGEFTNNYVKNGIFGDPNSAVFLHDFRGNYRGIPFTTKDMMIFNLKKPTASGSVKSDFDVTAFNSIFSKDLLQFTKGKATVSVQFKANVVDLKISKPFIIGNVSILNSDFTYGRSKFGVADCNLKMKFTQDKLDIRTFGFKTPKSEFQMKGYAGNFMNLYYDNPEKIVLNLDINCPKIDLSEFIFMLKQNKKGTTKKTTKTKNRSDFLEKALNSSNLSLNLKINKLTYKKFAATNAVANIKTSSDNITIEKVAIRKGNGAINLNGIIDRTGKNDDFNLGVNVSKLDIRDLLYSFDNFGSSTINYKNITGIIDLNTSLNGILEDNGGIARNSLNGNLNFVLKNGAFINFKPIENVGQKVFPKRNFKKVTFEILKGDFKISNRKVYISPMKINTSVLNFDLSGVYALEKGTNLLVDVYLRDPQKDKNIKNAKTKKKKRDEGMSVHLMAVDGPDGKVKVKLRTLKIK
ncbi:MULTISPECIES: AsmA family protein [Flavobacterium]|uniref:AsmA family protein n=1 Tax=Flavobacterium TaxID=237 RepID=UPI001FCBFF77|nr:MULTISPECIES: AsmA family protein [Flavobacterium]UOK41850.1 AsmA-like C-terminal region-containing protein [Flavobacterium enshiense]